MERTDFFLEQSDLERTDRIARDRGEGIGERETERLPLSGEFPFRSFLFLFFPSRQSRSLKIIYQKKLFIKKIIYQILALFYAKCVRLHVH